MSNSPTPSVNWPLRLAIVAGIVLAGYFGVAYVLRPVVIVVPATKGKSVRWVPGTVEVKAEFDRELKSAVGGRVKASALDIGKRVFKNDVLVQIDTGDIDLEIERIKNEITAAKKKVELGSNLSADVLNSKYNLDKLERQTKAGAYPAGDFAVAQRTHVQLEQKMELDETNNRLLLADWENSLRSKELEKSKMTITAPSDGQVTAVMAREGDLINKDSAIATYISLTRTVEGKLSEENFAAVKLGQKATVRFLTFGQDHYPAVISKVLPSADPLTQRYSIYLDVTLPEGRVLVPGITGEVTIIIAQHDNALLIPRRALAGDHVFVVDGGKLVKRKVVTGDDSLNLLEITSGLQEGDLVLAEPQDGFRDGERVRTQVSSK